MDSNNIVNFKESTTILNACTKKVWKFIEGTTYIKCLCSERRNLPPGSKRIRLCLACQAVKIWSLLEAEVFVCRPRLSREEIYLACKFLYAGTCIKELASSRGIVLLLLCGLLFWLTDWLTDWQNERVYQRYTEEGLLVACVVIFSQLRQPNCLRTLLLLLLGLVLQQSWRLNANSKKKL